MTATPLRTFGLGVVLAFATSLAAAQQTMAPPPTAAPPPGTMQGNMAMPPGSQPMGNPQVAAQADPMKKACRQQWKQAAASNTTNGQTKQQFMANCMQGH